MIKKNLILISLIVIILCISEKSSAVTISVPLTLPPIFGESGFGLIDPYRGETFVALTAHPEALTVFVGDANGNFPFHVLLTEVSTVGGLHPTAVLFESSTFTANLAPLAPFTVDLSAISLVPGQKYAWILDAFVTQGNNRFSADIGIDPTASFADGGPLSFMAFPIDLGTRTDNFAANPPGGFWFGDSRIDFAFSLSFAEVPEPSTWLLLGSGLIGFVLWRRYAHAWHSRPTTR